MGQDTHSSSPVARGSSFCPDLCGGCGALQLAPVSVLWLLYPWQRTAIWGAMTGPSCTKSPYLPRALQRKKKGGYSFPCPVAAKSRDTTKSWKEPPPPCLAKAVPPQGARCFLQPHCKARLGTAGLCRVPWDPTAAFLFMLTGLLHRSQRVGHGNPGLTSCRSAWVWHLGFGDGDSAVHSSNSLI